MKAWLCLFYVKAVHFYMLTGKKRVVPCLICNMVTYEVFHPELDCLSYMSKSHVNINLNENDHVTLLTGYNSII